MPANPQTFIADFRLYLQDSMDWCQKESEQESARIIVALQNVMEDVKRRSKMSDAAEKSLVEAQGRLALIIEGMESIGIEDLLQELRSLKSDNAEVSRLINPVIEALQFQDRLVQNLKNLEKIINYWFDLELKEDVAHLPDSATDDILKNLLKRVSTAEERDIVRKCFGHAPAERILPRTGS